MGDTASQHGCPHRSLRRIQSGTQHYISYGWDSLTIHLRVQARPQHFPPLEDPLFTALDSTGSTTSAAECSVDQLETFREPQVCAVSASLCVFALVGCYFVLALPHSQTLRSSAGAGSCANLLSYLPSPDYEGGSTQRQKHALPQPC